MSTFVYKVFHIEDVSQTSKERAVAAADIETRFSERYEKLETPTIKISNQEEVTAFLEKNPNFKLNGDGFTDLDGNVGWMFGEIGIWASNYTAWKNFLKTDADCLVLMEDDLFLTKGFFVGFDAFVDELPDDWDMLSVYVHPMHERFYTKEKEIGKQSICTAYQDWSLACYVINKSSAVKLVAQAETEVSLPPDWFFFKQLDKYKVYSPNPMNMGFCILIGTDSTYQGNETRAPVQGSSL